MGRFTYSRWDGTQVGFDLDADSLLEEMTDDLLYHGDLNAAMRRMMIEAEIPRNSRRNRACHAQSLVGNCCLRDRWRTRVML